MGRLPSVFAVLTAIAGLLYAVSIVVLHHPVHTPIALMLDGAFATVVLVAIYERVRGVSSGAALWGVVMALAGAIGATVHGGYDLAVAIRDAGAPTPGDVISAVDPRGLLTFLVGGAGLAVLASLMGRAGFSSRLVALAYLAAALSILLYFARLIAIDPAKPVIAGPVVLDGFVVHPLLYVWLAFALRRGSPPSAA